TQRDLAGVDAVLEVVHGVGHVVGPVHDLGLDAARFGRRRGGAEPREHLDVLCVRTELGGVFAAGPGVLGGGIEYGTGGVEGGGWAGSSGSRPRPRRPPASWRPASAGPSCAAPSRGPSGTGNGRHRTPWPARPPSAPPREARTQSWF